MSLGRSRTIELYTPDPFLRKMRFDYVLESGIILIIPTGERTVLLQQKFMKCGSEYYQCEIVSKSYVRDLFVSKYGIRHFSRYFSNSSYALKLIPTQMRPEVGKELEKIFDGMAPSYEMELMKNPVQRYMREVTSSLLRKYSKEGCSVLDLGCGPMIESLTLPDSILLTGADISSGMLNEAMRRAAGRGNVKLVKTDMELSGTFSQYDIIYSTYGAMELLGHEKMKTFVTDHLKDGGVFIICFWNSLGLLDNLLALFAGKFSYVLQKIAGKVHPNQSRHQVYTKPSNPFNISAIFGAKVLERTGVCLIVPPYNYNRLITAITKLSFITRIDRFLGSCPLMWIFSDYVAVVMQPNRH